MDLYDVMRTTFAAREFTDDPLPDDVLYRIFDVARFAPSGGNRKAARDRGARRRHPARIAELSASAARRYFAQMEAGESPWNPLHPSAVPSRSSTRPKSPKRFSPRWSKRRLYWSFQLTWAWSLP